ncbi:MAG: hypothetical protein OEZ68_10215 [Gammaproteobacteria bacterium]|nr:hypothetical protein [Gammaproteobacteria bacterium]MDH5801164.1 hypothetical protein [Gammaproteobacteria bacterium]
MSELQISDELIHDLQQALVKVDARANDPGFAVQYLAAVLGYVVGEQPGDYDEKSEYLNQLLGFAQHVFDDVAAPAAVEDEAFGVWKPGDE